VKSANYKVSNCKKYTCWNKHI